MKENRNINSARKRKKEIENRKKNGRRTKSTNSKREYKEKKYTKKLK